MAENAGNLFRQSVEKAQSQRLGINAVGRGAVGERLVEQSRPTTQAPSRGSILTTIRSTTDRAKVLKLLQHLLSTTTPATTTTTTSTPQTTAATTTRKTALTTMATRPDLARLLASKPKLRFEQVVLPEVEKLGVPATAVRPLPPNVTPASPLYPHSPFPLMEAPQHDVISSHLLLPDNRQLVTPASPVHPASPFPRLEAPKPDVNPALQFLQDYKARFAGNSLDQAGRLGLSGDLNPTANPGSFNTLQRHEKSLRGSGLLAPRPRQDSPTTTVYPVPRTRMIAPHSGQPGLDRRLSLDGPTESSLTPLEILAKKTVPQFQPDASFFGTPRSRVEKARTPLETLTTKLKHSENERNNFFDDLEPVQRIRHQRNHLTAGGDQPGAEDSSRYLELPGVKTGTTAVGLVEHREGAQPLFHVPVFTTPIPRNGQFIKLNPKPIPSTIQSAVNKIKTVLSAPVDGLRKIKHAIEDGLTKSRDGVLSGPHRPGTLTTFRKLSPLPQPTQRTRLAAGRPLQKFPRYTKMTNFVYNSCPSGSCLPSIPIMLSLLAISIANLRLP